MEFIDNMQNFDELDIEGRNPTQHLEANREKEEHDRKRLMRSSVTAEDGTLRPVYTETNDGDIWCHICNVALFGAHKLISHNTCNRHKIKLDEWPYPTLLWSKGSDTVKTVAPTQAVAIGNTLAPGEPIPPGMEDQITRTTTIQVSLDRHRSSPLVGLEYLLELVDSDSCEPSYTCVLCDKRGDPRTVMAHITSYNHRIAYLNRHFPTISRKITELPRTPNYKRGANEISVLVAKEIEERFGRLQPQLVDKSQFEKNKMQYIKRVYQDYHFRETPELTFMDVYDVRWVTNFEEKMAEMAVSGGSSKKDTKTKEDQFEEKNEKEEKNNDKLLVKKHESKMESSKSGFKIRIFTKDKLKLRKLTEKSEESLKICPKRPSDETRSLSSLSSISSSPSPSRSRSRSPIRHRKISSVEKSGKYRGRSRYSRERDRLRSHTRSRSRSLEPIRERDKWDKYREQIKRAEEALDRALKFHEKNPEKHPAYPDEWKKFWNRRYKELQADGKDPSKHDFKPEWIEFWNKRMREIHNEQLMQRKEEIKKRLDLPDDKPQEKWIPPNKRDKVSPKRSKHRIDSDDDVEYVGTKTIKSDYYDRYDSRDRDYMHSAYMRGRGNTYRSYYHRVPSRSRPSIHHHYTATSYPVKETSPCPTIKDEVLSEDMEVVGLLRLLTALEGQLGSLGPKIVSLLSKALAAEKVKPNSAEELLYDEDVNVLFETVKEKLKGQLFAGMVEKMAINPTKSAIQNIAQLLHKASESKKKLEEEKKKKREEEILETTRPVNFICNTLYNRSSDILTPVIKSEPVSVPGIGTVDKVAIAQQIAAALVAQGRTNVSQEELETLINAVVGMAEASKNSSKPVTTADFVKGLAASSSNLSSVPSVTQSQMQPSITLSALPIKASPQVLTLMSTSATAPLALTSTSVSTSAATSASNTTSILPMISSSSMKIENLSDDDLKKLLQNFKDLSTQEQHSLINFLKKLEATDSARVEKLRAFVNLGGALSIVSATKIKSPTPELIETLTGKTKSISPFSIRKGIQNSIDDEEKWKPKLDIFADEDEVEHKRNEDDEKTKTKIELSDDDDDYTFEDIYKAANKNLKENEKAKRTLHSFSKSGSNSPKSWSRSRSPSRSCTRSRSNSRSETPIKSKDIHKINDPAAILNETKRLIANIMGELPNKYSSKTHSNNMTNAENNAISTDQISNNFNINQRAPQNFYDQNYVHGNQQQQQQQQQQQSCSRPQAPTLSFSNTSSQQQYQNYPPPQQTFNSNTEYIDNGYNYHEYNNIANQSQYQTPSIPVNHYTHQQSYVPSQYGAPSNLYLPPPQQQQSSYGNYTQHRFY